MRSHETTRKDSRGSGDQYKINEYCMEVASIFTRFPETEKFLIEYLSGHERLILSNIHMDSYYFNDKLTGRHEFYIHTKLDVNYELSYNYSQKAKSCLKSYFNQSSFELIDISYRSVESLRIILIQFFDDLVKVHGAEYSDFIIDESFNGLATIDQGEFKYLQVLYCRMNL